MSDSIDLSELQSLSFRPDWVDTNKQDAATPSSEVVWNFTESRGGRGGGGGKGGDRQDRGDRRGPRNDGGGRNFDNRSGGGGQERRGPGGPGQGQGQRREGGRPPGGGGGFGAKPGGPGQQRPGGPGGQGQQRPFGDRPPRPAGGRPQGDRPPRRDGPGGGSPGGNRGPRNDDRRDSGGGVRGPRRDDRRDGHRDDQRQQDERPRLAHGWCARIQPEPRAVEALSKQIKASGRAYSVFDVAKLFLSARDRYLVHFFYKDPTPSARDPQAAEAPPAPAVAPELVQCTLDSSLWLTKDEAIRHIRNSAAMNELYAEETVAVDPPKGNFSAIAVCGFSGALLGPPNHHSFPVNVARLHREEFYNLSLEHYKSRVRVEKGEEIVAKWLEQQSSERQYVCTKVAEGEEAPRFKTLAERDAHFLKNFADDSLKTVREITIMGNIPGKLLSPALLSLLRVELDGQNRFPMNLVQELCRELENHGLRFFKRDKKTTFVCRSRPQFIGDNVPLSDRVRSIIEMVRANSGIGYGKIVGVLAPPAPEPAPVAAAEGETPVAAEPPAPTLSMAELAVMQDIKWLVQEGFLTEFANGELHILGREHREKKPGAEDKSRPAPASQSTPAEPSPPSASDEAEAAPASEAPTSEVTIPEALPETPAPAAEVLPEVTLEEPEVMPEEVPAEPAQPDAAAPPAAVPEEVAAVASHESAPPLESPAETPAAPTEAAATDA